MVRMWRNFDWVLLGSLVFLLAAGLVSLASSNSSLFQRQLLWAVLALFVIFGGSQINWRWFVSSPVFRYGFYWLSISFLVLTLLQSGTIRGTKSWISIAGFQFEPSELTKVALIIILAGFFSKRYLEAWLGKNIIASLFYALIPTTLVALQPDFGSALIIASIWIGFTLVSGINKKRMIIGLVLGAVVLVLLWSFFLQDYQKNRLLGFMSPERDPLGINYNVIQSKIAIGSAGWWGKGFGSGTQTQLRFLPETQTDFLFAAFVEEWGIFGGLLLVLIFLSLIARISFIGLKAKNNDYKFIALGTSLVLLTHFFINIGSNLGIVPVTGLPLPFVSYGGSSLLTFAILISIIERIKLDSSF